MKPLTIEQLKALEAGDWVWVVDLYSGVNSGYVQIDDNFVDCVDFSDYGTNWLAYKNKEQAEAKGEIVELPSLLRTRVLQDWYNDNVAIEKEIAVKEFAEKLKPVILARIGVFPSFEQKEIAMKEIDELVKEICGE